MISNGSRGLGEPKGAALPIINDKKLASKCHTYPGKNASQGVNN